MAGMLDDSVFEELGLLPPAARMPSPVPPQTVAAALERSVAERGDHPALIGRNRRYSFFECDAAIDAAAAGLLALGIAPLDRVAVTGRNDPELVIAFHACLRIGAIWTGISRLLSPIEKAAQLRDCGVALYIADEASLAEVAVHRGDLPDLRVTITMEPATADDGWRRLIADHAGAAAPGVAVDPFAPAIIAYTSGTTGKPKGVVHSQHNLMVATVNAMPAGVTRYGCALALTTANIMINHGLAALRHGVTLVCMDRLDAEGVLEWADATGIDGFRVPPPILYDLLTRPEYASADLTRFVYLATAGAPPSRKLHDLYAARMGRPLLYAYGLSEAPGIVTELALGDRLVEGAIGRPLPHLDVRILRDDGSEAADGESGEICVRAARHGEWADVYTPMLGYWRLPGATREALADGWLHTGDLGYREASGLLFINARRSEMILRGGANIYPPEIENIIQEDARVRESVVVGVADERLGQIVVAVIEHDPAITADALEAELRGRLAERLARYKRPAHWLFSTQLPRNAMGKIDRRAVRELAERATAATGQPQAAAGGR